MGISITVQPVGGLIISSKYLDTHIVPASHFVSYRGFSFDIFIISVTIHLGGSQSDGPGPMDRLLVK